VARFARREIVAGQVVGTGGFSVVSEVVDVLLDPSVDAALSPEDVEARHRLVDSGLFHAGAGARRGRPKYVLKHLQESLGREMLEAGDPSAFVGAAVDLILEAEYLRRLDHPHVARLAGTPLLPLARPFLDSAPDGRGPRHDAVFLLLEAVDGTLEDEIQREMAGRAPSGEPSAPVSPPPPPTSVSSLDRKLSAGIQLAQALSHLHSLGLVFRDLKPHNVGLVRSGDDDDDRPGADPRVVLLDFGLCRQLPCFSDTDGPPLPADLRQACLKGVYHMSAVGTRRYMAAEVVNSSRYNQLADVYGLGIVLWEYLLGDRAFPSYTVDQHALHVCAQGERPCTRPLPAEIRRLLAQCWTEDVGARLAADEAAALLASILRSRQHDRELSFGGSLERSGSSLSSCGDDEMEEPPTEQDNDEYRVDVDWDDAIMLSASTADDFERVRRCQDSSYLSEDAPFCNESSAPAHPVSPLSRLGSLSGTASSFWPPDHDHEEEEEEDEDRPGLDNKGRCWETVRTGISTVTTHSLSSDEGHEDDDEASDGATPPRGISVLLPAKATEAMPSRIAPLLPNPFDDDDNDHQDGGGDEATVLSHLTLASGGGSSCLSPPPASPCGLVPVAACSRYRRWHGDGDDELDGDGDLHLLSLLLP
jgi:serine/threonine protein kinase